MATTPTKIPAVPPPLVVPTAQSLASDIATPALSVTDAVPATTDGVYVQPGASLPPPKDVSPVLRTSTGMRPAATQDTKILGHSAVGINVCSAGRDDASIDMGEIDEVRVSPEEPFTTVWSDQIRQLPTIRWPDHLYQLPTKPSSSAVVPSSPRGLGEEGLTTCVLGHHPSHHHQTLSTLTEPSEPVEGDVNMNWQPSYQHNVLDGPANPTELAEASMTVTQKLNAMSHALVPLAGTRTSASGMATDKCCPALLVTQMSLPRGHCQKGMRCTSHP